MARGVQQSIGKEAASSTFDIGRSSRRSKNDHKVVLESVTQEKKKLRSVITFKIEPPTGYTFIPAGNPELTNALKECAKDGNHEVYAVSTTRHHQAHHLSQQVHRIGFHFPSVVVSQVCAHYGIVLSSAGTVLEEDEYPVYRRSQRLKEKDPSEARKDQITVNTEARDTIKDLFPNIPDNDMNQIIKTAFQKGKGKVGTAAELTLIRRAQLAVVAHIRHIYTDYDKLIRQTQYRDARNIVEKPTLRKLVEWRGDDEDGKAALEDIFREVIVISDDEESSDEDEFVEQDFRDVSVEIVSSNTRAADLEPESRITEPHLVEYTERHGAVDGQVLSNQLSGRLPRKQRGPDMDKVARRGFSRYQAWKGARDEYRADHRATAPSVRDTAVKNSVRAAPSTVQTSYIQSEERRQGALSEAQDISQARNQFRRSSGMPADPIYVRDTNYIDPSGGFQMNLHPDHNGMPVGQRMNAPNGRSLLRHDSNQYNGLRSKGSIPVTETSPRTIITEKAPGSTQHRAWEVQPQRYKEALQNNDAPMRANRVEFIDMTADDATPKKRKVVDDAFHVRNIDAYSTEINEPWYASAVSPADVSLQTRDVHSGFPRYHYRGVRDVENVQLPPSNSVTAGLLSSRPTYLEPMTADRPAARKSLGPHSNLTYDSLEHINYTPRQSIEVIPRRRSRSPLQADNTSIDRGVQEYRAFRARERKQQVLDHRAFENITPESQPVLVRSRSRDLSHLRRAPTNRAPMIRLQEQQPDSGRARPTVLVSKRDETAAPVLRRRRSTSPYSHQAELVELIPVPRERHARQDEAAWPTSARLQRAITPERPARSDFLRTVEGSHMANGRVEYLTVVPTSNRPRSATCKRYYAQL